MIGWMSSSRRERASQALDDANCIQLILVKTMPDATDHKSQVCHPQKFLFIQDWDVEDFRLVQLASRISADEHIVGLL